jgi:hypothetical protein
MSTHQLILRKDIANAERIRVQTHARLPITETRRPRTARLRRHDRDEHSMTDHTTPLPEHPADPTRDPEGDPLTPPSPGHHESPQQPEGPPSKDPI